MKVWPGETVSSTAALDSDRSAEAGFTVGGGAGALALSAGVGSYDVLAAVATLPMSLPSPV